MDRGAWGAYSPWGRRVGHDRRDLAHIQIDYVTSKSKNTDLKRLRTLTIFVLVSVCIAVTRYQCLKCCCTPITALGFTLIIYK